MTHSKKPLILVNPAARNGRVGTLWRMRGDEVLQALGVSDDCVKMTSPVDHGGGIVRKALQQGVRKVVVVGGDGTLSSALQGFFNENKAVAPDAVLAVMPCGRGDDFFKTLTNERYYSADSVWSKGLKVLKEGSPSAVDVGLLNWTHEGKPLGTRYFINVASFGYPGLVVQRVQARGGWFKQSFIASSALTYAVHGLGAWLDYKPVFAQIKTDGAILFEGKLSSCFILNGRYNAGGICWDSRADVRDGQFQVVLVEAGPLGSTLRASLGALRGSLKKRKGLYREAAKSLSIQFESRKKSHPYFEIDGDLSEPPEANGASVELVSSAVQFLGI